MSTVSRRKLEQDAASLLRFVDSLITLIRRSKSERVYSTSSTVLVNYLCGLGEQTKLFLEVFPAKLPEEARLQQAYPQKLSSIRDGWYTLHQFVKVALDADTLNVPLAFLEALSRRFRSIPSFRSASFAVIHTHDVNYLQISANWMRGITQQLADLIPGAQEFPKDFGLIGIPYSQSEAVLFNCVIPHEMGHFAFQHGQARSLLEAEYLRVLDSAFAGASIEPNSWERVWWRDRLASWCEEVFCDLIGVRIVGPAYSLALVELLDLGALLGGGTAAHENATLFNESHPAHAFRLQQQVGHLTQLGWRPHLEALQGHYGRVLFAIESLDQPWLFRDRVPEAQVSIAALKNLMPMVHQQVAETTVGMDDGVKEFGRLHDTVERYLHHGLVPSTIIHEGKEVHPSFTTIVNAAYWVYLESLDELLVRIKDVKQDSPSERSWWTRRLEAWTMKAVEDEGILRGATE